MLMLKEKKTHKMKIDAGYLHNPAGAHLKWPNDPSVKPEDVDVTITISSEKQAVVIPVDVLRSLMASADSEFQKKLNKRIDIISSEQINLKGVVQNYDSVGGLIK